MKLSTILTVLIFFNSPLALANSLPILKNERALIAVVNLSILAKKNRALYRIEEKKAAKLIQRKLSPYYGNLIIFSNHQATRENFLSALREAELDPKIKVIDSIIYLHGIPNKIGFTDTHFYPIDKIRDEILSLIPETGHGPTKLRALYSDACYGESHISDLLKSGYKVVSGSVGTDSNWAADLRKFMRVWTQGETFSHGILKANSVITTPITDWVINGDSTKKLDGILDLTINSTID